MKAPRYILALVALVLLAALPATAQSWLFPNFYTNVSVPAIVTTGGLSNITSQPITIRPGSGVTLTAAWGTTNASTTNTTWTINVTPDGTNWATVAPYTIKAANTASKTNTWTTNLPPAWFDGYYQFRLEAWTNDNNTDSIFPKFIGFGRTRLDY